MGGADNAALYCKAGKAIGFTITNLSIITDKLKICTFALQNKYNQSWVLF